MRQLSILTLIILGAHGGAGGDPYSHGHNWNRGAPGYPNSYTRRAHPYTPNGKNRVRPSFMSAVAEFGSSALEAAQSFRAQAEPLVREGAAQLKQTVDTHIIPNVKAGLMAMGQSAVEGVDKFAESMVVKNDTAQAFDTIARAIMPNSSQAKISSNKDISYRPYAQDDIVSSQLLLQDAKRHERESPYKPKLSHPPELGSRHVDGQPYSQNLGTEELKTLTDYDYDGDETTGEGEKQTVEEALYVLGKNILGQDVTDKILPVAKKFAEGLGQLGQGISENLPPLPTVEFDNGKLRLMPGTKDKSRFEATNGLGQRDQRHTGSTDLREESPTCTTPDGDSGRCMDIQNCPILLADFNRLRKSICFKALFVPGVCCPDHGITLADFGSGNVTKPDVGSVIDQGDVDNGFAVQPQGTTSRPRPQTTGIPSLSDLSTTSAPPSPFIEDAATKVPGTNIECGLTMIPQGRIVGGNATFEGQNPWMVAIYLHGNGKKEFWCGGALVSEYHVVTAAHCTKDAKKKQFLPTQFTVKVGEWDLSDDDDYSREINVIDIRSHPDFKANGFYNDVAVLKLAERVKMNPYVQPICLPTGSILHRDLTGTLPVALGWGTTYYGGKEVDILRAVALPVWTNKDCDNAYFQPITDIFLCAGFAQGGRDACQGDSGGPLKLYDEKTNRWTLIGVVSFGNRCAEPGYPGVYTRLTKFTNWILANMA